MFINTWPMLGRRDLNGVQPLPLHRLRDQWHFSTHDLMPVTPILIVALVLAAFVATVWAWRSGRLFGPRPASLSAYYKVIADFGFTRAEKLLLIRIAQQQRLPTPVTLLLSVATFQTYTQKYAQLISPRAKAKYDARIEHIRQIIFGITGMQGAKRRLS